MILQASAVSAGDKNLSTMVNALACEAIKNIVSIREVVEFITFVLMCNGQFVCYCLYLMLYDWLDSVEQTELNNNAQDYKMWFAPPDLQCAE